MADVYPSVSRPSRKLGSDSSSSGELNLFFMCSFHFALIRAVFGKNICMVWQYVIKNLIAFIEAYLKRPRLYVKCLHV